MLKIVYNIVHNMLIILYIINTYIILYIIFFAIKNIEYNYNKINIKIIIIK